VKAMARPQIAKTPLAERLTEVRKALGYEARQPFAQLLKMHPDTLGGYERGDSTPDHEFLGMYKRRFGVNIDWLITGEGPMFTPKEVTEFLARQAGGHAIDPSTGSGGLLHAALDYLDDNRALPAKLQKADFVNLPQYDVRASAGRGLIPINEMPVSQTAFERSFLRSLGGAPDFCFMMWSTGDSMFPTIPDNALLIVDSSQTIVDHGRIYVFSVGSAVLVKRAKWRMDGRLELASDNVEGNYPSETFDADRVEDLVVVGRVIFIGHQS